MQSNHYAVQSGDTLGMIARKFTGNRERWPELVQANPQIPQIMTPDGKKTFDPELFEVGQHIRVPNSWVPAGMLGAPGTGMVGVGCSSPPSPVAPYPGVLYMVHDNMMPSAAAATDFNQITSGGWGDWSALNGANVGFWKPGFVQNGEACSPAQWANGIFLRVPKKWLDGLPPTQLAALPAVAGGYLFLDDGVTPWVPGTIPGVTPGKTPGVPGTQGDCPVGQMLGSDGVTCVDQGTGKKVVATDTSTGVSSWVWIALAAGAGIGGALLLYQFTKPKTVRGAPPPPVKKEEIVVRR